MATSLKAALISAKSGEAAGYHLNFPGSQSVPKVSAVKPSSIHSTEVDELKEEVHQLRKMMEDHLHIKPRARSVPRRSKSTSTCHRCNGPGHIQRKCLWTGHRTALPDVLCQICNQYGHNAHGYMRFAQPPPINPRADVPRPYQAAPVQMNQGNYHVPRSLGRTVIRDRHRSPEPTRTTDG